MNSLLNRVSSAPELGSSTGYFRRVKERIVGQRPPEIQSVHFDSDELELQPNLRPADIERMADRFEPLFADHLRAKRLVIALMPRKTASQTTEQTLLSSHPRRRTFVGRTHFLSSRAIGSTLESVNDSRLPEADRRSYLYQCVYASILDRIRRQRLESRRRKSVSIIAATRDPIAAALSNVFQLWRQYAADPFELTPERMQEILCRPGEVGFEEWCRRELDGHLDARLLGERFDRERGWKIYERGRYRLGILRFENLRELTPFLGRIVQGRICRENANLSSDKDYFELYRSVRRETRLPTEFVDSVYAGPYVRHFYEPAELEAFRARWTRAQAP